MKRRSFLGLLASPLVGLLFGLLPFGRAKAASALGGGLPPLDQPAPRFRLSGVAPAPVGEEPILVELGLEDFPQQWVILYFYPRDFTSGCTLEARGFQRDLETFHGLHAQVVGVSTDPVDSHGEFCGAEGLRYPLLSDPEGAVCRRYGSWLAPSALRHTFLIDPEGVLRARWVAVQPRTHSQEVLATLAKLQQS